MLGSLSAEEIEDVLRTNVVGRIGCLSAGRPYVVPVCYVYDDGSILGHTMPGAKQTALRAHPDVCFEVDEVGATLSQWRSVIAWGRAEFPGGDIARRDLDVLVRRIVPLLGRDVPHDHPDPEVVAASGVYRIRLDEKSGRFER